MLDLDKATAWASAAVPHTNIVQCKKADELIVRLAEELRLARPIVADARKLDFLKGLAAKVAAYDQAVGR